MPLRSNAACWRACAEREYAVECGALPAGAVEICAASSICDVLAGSGRPELPAVLMRAQVPRPAKLCSGHLQELRAACLPAVSWPRQRSRQSLASAPDACVRCTAFLMRAQAPALPCPLVSNACACAACLPIILAPSQC